MGFVGGAVVEGTIALPFRAQPLLDMFTRSVAFFRLFFFLFFFFFKAETPVLVNMAL
uniref:Uncharacterized protein n=1 Tax=Anguilla anguilla TaxID=7936 RepID=A0A0E9SDT4_ANGAN